MGSPAVVYRCGLTPCLSHVREIKPTLANKGISHKAVNTLYLIAHLHSTMSFQGDIFGAQATHGWFSVMCNIKSINQLWQHASPCYNISAISPTLYLSVTIFIKQSNNQANPFPPGLCPVLPKLCRSTGFTFLVLWFDTMGVDSAIYVLIAAVTPVKFLVSFGAITSEVS